MDLSTLNEQQQKAVRKIDGPLLILAGAGSGKTSTMTHRIAYMVEQGIKPYSILAVTFTNKAAGEMRDRVVSLLGEEDLHGMWIMTFHAMCLRILRSHAESIGRVGNFVVYDTADQKALVKNIIKEQNINDKQFNPQYLLSIISKCKEKVMSPEKYIATYGEDVKTKVIYRVYKEYEDRLIKNGAMDFDDLLLNALKVLTEDRNVLESYRDRFRYIMVDEYQDTNQIQYMLIKLLSEKNRNLCVVGDDDQCIYEWRGADIRNILDFEKDFPDAMVIKLEQNYRSCGNILKAAHSVVKNNRGRKEKKLWTTREDGSKVKYYRAESDKDEARYIAQQIRLMKDETRKYSDFAILYRTNAQSRGFEESLTREDIPYRVLSGFRYYDKKEIKDMLAYMRLVTNPDDELSLRRIINEPKRGMGDKTVEKLAALASVYGETLYQTLERPEVQKENLSAKAEPLVRDMLEVIDMCRAEAENLRVADIYDNLLVKTGYLKALEEQDNTEAEGRIEYLMDFKSVINDYEEGATDTEEGPGLSGFMEKIALMAEVDNHDETQDAVVLMTMHSAKGLEFPVVFLPGLEDGLFPGNKAFDNPDGMEEERRLCYVGMTRAKEELLLTSAAVRTLYGKTDYTRESQFLRELDKSVVEGDAIYERKQNAYGGPGVSTGTIDGYGEKNPYKPFDALKYIKQETKAKVNGETDFESGDRVLHGKFGEGLVLEADEKTVTVIFDSAGRKKLAKGLAPLKKI